MRKATAALMSRAAREIPHYYVVNTFDITDTLAWLREFNAGRKPATGYYRRCCSCALLSLPPKRFRR